MAVFQSHIFSDIRGKLCGCQFSKHHSGVGVISPLRSSRATIGNNSSNIHSIFSKVSNEWNSSSFSFRKTWNEYSKALGICSSGRLEYFRSRMSVLLMQQFYNLPIMVDKQVPSLFSSIDLEPVIADQRGPYSTKIEFRIRQDYDIIEGDAYSKYLWFYATISRAYSINTKSVSSRIHTHSRNGSICVSGSSKYKAFTGLIPNSSYFFDYVIFRHVNGWQVSKVQRIRLITLP